MHLAVCRGWLLPRPSPRVPQGQSRPWASAATYSLETLAVGTVLVPCSLKVLRLEIAKWDTEKDKFQGGQQPGLTPLSLPLSSVRPGDVASLPAFPALEGALRRVLSTPYSVLLLWPDVGRGGEKCPLMRWVKSASYMDRGVPFPDFFHGTLISCNTF